MSQVRIYKFKPEPYAIESSFLSLQASSKKGSNIVQSVKLVKVNGAVVSITTSHDSKHIAVGSDQGYVRYHFFFSFFALFVTKLT